jgi:hypothetical protein
MGLLLLLWYYEVMVLFVLVYAYVIYRVRHKSPFHCKFAPHDNLKFALIIAWVLPIIGPPLILANAVCYACGYDSAWGNRKDRQIYTTIKE